MLLNRCCCSIKIPLFFPMILVIPFLQQPRWPTFWPCIRDQNVGCRRRVETYDSGCLLIRRPLQVYNLYTLWRFPPHSHLATTARHDWLIAGTSRCLPTTIRCAPSWRRRRTASTWRDSDTHSRTGSIESSLSVHFSRRKIGFWSSHAQLYLLRLLPTWISCSNWRSIGSSYSK